MLKSLQVIQKIAKAELDEEARKLADLNHTLMSYEYEQMDCGNRIISETLNKTEENMAYVPQFINAMRTRIKSLEGKIEEQNKLVEVQENIVREHFMNTKKYEVTIDVVKGKIEEEEKRKEQIEFDDISQRLWFRANFR